MSGPLSGIRILDLTHVWAGPLAVRFLSDLGAEVVKIEAPYGRGPQTAAYSPLGGWMSGDPGDEPWNRNALFTKLHRNRRSLCLDLKQESAREVFLQLVAIADVLVENFSAHAMANMGLPDTTLRQANPNLINVSMPGFGSTGPYCNRVAFGPIVEPMSGLTTMLGYSAQEPRNSAMALMDPIGGTSAAAAITRALRHRRETGKGCRVELSLHEGGVSYSGPWLIDEQLGNAPTCIGNRHPGMAPHGVFRCRGDDHWIAIACQDDDAWRRLAIDTGAGDPDWKLETRQANADEIEAALSAWSAERSRESAVSHLQTLGVAAGAVNTTPDMLNDEQVIHRGFFVPYERFNTPMPGNAAHMAGIDPSSWRACPRLGENNAEVLTDWLDLPASQIAELEANGVLLDKPPG